jgi:hypothetical protein
MAQSAKDEEPALTPYENRLWVEVDRILYQNYLTPRAVTDFWQGDHDAIVAHLKQMKDRVVRSVIITHYVELDDVLNRTILNHFFGKRRLAARNRKYATLKVMLDRLYLQHKLDIVRTFKKVPSDLVSNIMALNTIRNNFAPRFDLSEVPKSKRLYKGKYDVFQKKGLRKFRDDMWDIDEFLQPDISKWSLELVTHQRQRNRAMTGSTGG